MIFLHLSRDHIDIVSPQETLCLSTQELEKNLPHELTKLLRNTKEKEIAVLNGPGSFTTLRLGCMILNQINLLLGNTLTFRTCTKIDLYSHAYKAKFIPANGYMYIGQRSNVWEVDLLKKTETKIPCTLIVPQQDIYFVDYVSDHMMLDYIDKHLTTKIGFQDTNILLSYGEKTAAYDIKELCQKSVSYLTPSYLIEPTIGSPVSPLLAHASA